MDVSGKVALVTGGASGLGWATVQTLAKAGAKVAILDLNEELGQQRVSELGENALFAKTNVADEESVTAAIADIMNRFGAIHICVNCAGIGSASRTVGREKPMALNIFSMVVTINLIGSFNVLRLAAFEMAKNEPLNDDGERGVIINTASAAAFDGQVGQAAYSASKGGVVGMTLPIARDLASLGIRVMTIAPGIFDTPLMNMAPDEVKQPLINMTQFPKRLGHPDEFAAMVQHIAENTFLNGEVIRLDGGIRMAPR